MAEWEVSVPKILITAGSKREAVAQVALMLAEGLGPVAVKAMLERGSIGVEAYTARPDDVVHVAEVPCPCGRYRGPAGGAPTGFRAKNPGPAESN